METAHLDLTDWSWQPSVVLGLLALVVAYAVAMRRGWLRDDDDVSPWFRSARWRPVLFGAGIVTAFVALQSPIDTGGDEYLLSLHMVQHLLLMMVAPPLVLLGICGARPVPDRVLPRLRRLWTAVTRPWPATLLFNAVLLVWHIPALYDATLTDENIHIVEHLTFIGVGVVLFWPVVDPLRRAGTRLVTPFQKIGALTVAGVPPTILGFLFAVAGSPFYDFYARAPRLWGLSAISDQQIAGVIMFGVGNLIYFVPISIIFLRLVGGSRSSGDDEEAAVEAYRADPSALRGLDLHAGEVPSRAEGVVR